MGFTLRQVGPGLDDVTREQSRALGTAMRAAGRDAARKGERAITDNAGRRWGRSFDGKRLGVRTTVRADNAGANVELNAQGPWGVPEGGADAHGIVAHGRALRTASGRYAARVRHPGVRARHAWSGAESRVDDAAAEAFEDAADRAFLRG